MTPIAFETLLTALMLEYKQHKSFLSVPVNRSTDLAYCSKIGPAAGPHTQLAGNLVAAYGAGASHMELKTVQIMEGEELGIIKPCIYTSQEVYNTEWSTELTVEEAGNEYIKAYLLLKILIQEFQLGNPDTFHFIMSVGYDLKGIQSKKIDSFIDHMKNATDTKEWKADIEVIKSKLSEFEHITEEYVDTISPCVSNTITLSTMHGCKSEEIENIAAYLLEEKKVDTYVKLNPTLLGKENIQQILTQMGYTKIKPVDEVFEEDIRFDDAVQMIENLKKTAEKEGRIFGVKLTNTLPVKNLEQELVGETKYLSGSALYPIAISVASKLAEAFSGDLPISYSGGADKNNICDILSTGIYPVTVSSILLKTGGYKNLTVMNRIADQSDYTNNHKLDVDALKSLADKASGNSIYFNKEQKTYERSHAYTSLCAKCNNCVDVCPNRANKKMTVQGQKVIVHYDDLCNECGNCSFFCIAGHDPYLEKLTIFRDKQSYLESKNSGIFVQDTLKIHRLLKEEEIELVKKLEEEYEF